MFYHRVIHLTPPLFHAQTPALWFHTNSRRKKKTQLISTVGECLPYWFCDAPISFLIKRTINKLNAIDGKKERKIVFKC